MDEQRLEDCRASFLAAWNIHRNYQVAGNLALCEAKLGRNADAAEHAAFFLHEMPPTAPADRKASAEALFKEIRPKVAELSIRVNKSGAEVFLDGRSIGHAPLAASVFVEPGDRKVEARFGDAMARNTVSAKGGGTHEVALTFEEAKPPQPRSALPAFILGGAAVVAAGVGIGLNVAAQDGDRAAKGTFDDIRSKAGTCVDGAPNYDARCGDLLARTRGNDVMSRTSVGLFIGAGALAGGAVLYWLWPGAAPVKLGASVQPGTAASVRLSGSF